MKVNKIYMGDTLTTLQSFPDQSVQMCVTSPPYFGLRDYGVDGQLGLERTPQEYIDVMVEVFREVRRVLKNDGTLWLNIGDSYAGSWGAQSRGSVDESSTLEGGSMLSARQIAAHPGGTNVGSLKNTPGSKNKDLIGIPWMLALALKADGWYLRSEIIWNKPNPMPESVTDRPTKSHETIFLLAKSECYYYDQEAIRERAKDSTVARVKQDVDAQAASLRVPGKTNGPMKAVVFGGNRAGEYGDRRKSGKEYHPRMAGGAEGIADRKDHTLYATANKKTVWTIATQPFKEAHFAVFPPKLIVPPIKAGSRQGDTVLDPFMGSGTTALVCKRLNRNYVGIELNPDYIKIAERRLSELHPSLFEKET